VKEKLRAAAFQMATGPDVTRNAETILDAIERASAHGADLLVVPECALSDYLPSPDLDFELLAEAESEIARRAAERGLYVALGVVRRQGGRWFNTAILVSPSGETIGSYDKTHLFEGGREIFTPGDSLPVFRCGRWTVGLQICFDVRFPENWRILRGKGAELALHLSNASRGARWKLPVLEGAVRSRAAENGIYVVSANDARAPQMMVSAICAPDGTHLAQAPQDEETVIYAELNLSEVNSDFLAARRTDIWRRPENRPFLLE